MDVLKTLKSEGFVFSKKYGQNFITDETLLSSIVSDAGVTETDTVVEIGAGAGTLTRAIADKAKHVIAFEIDRSLEPILNSTLSGYDNVEVIYDDVTKWTESEFDALVDGEYKVVANLPYYITTPLLFMLLDRKKPPVSLTVMVQKEVAERICATEKKGDYGALSVSVGARAKATITRVVGREMFTPPPNVDSAVVRIDVHGNTGADDDKTLYSLIRVAFAMKRKTLSNNLAAGYGITKQEAEKMLTSAGFDPRVRAEELSVQKFVELSNKIYHSHIAK